MQEKKNPIFQNHRITTNATMLKGVISTVRNRERYFNNNNNNGGGHANGIIKCNNRPMDEMYGSDEFRMYAYKIKPCPRTRSHDWTQCPYAHRNEKAQRRDPCKFNYSAIAYPAFRDGRCCPRGDACEYAHGVFEYWLHPTRYRTRECNAGKYCQRKVCFFAHSPEQLRPEPEKTRYAWRMRVVDIVKESKAADETTTKTVVNNNNNISISGATSRDDDDDNNKKMVSVSAVSEFLRNKLSIRSGSGDQETDAPDYLPHLAWISDLVD